MKQFLCDDFLLDNSTAKKLYHDYAAKMPIIDYHCHISPKEIAEDRKFLSLTEIWLHGDHYKWRLMRACSVEERYITGDADDFDKFVMYAKSLKYAIGNPLYVWSHLELKRYFGCDLTICPENAKEIWEHCNTMLKRGDMSARGIIAKSNVTHIGTTDDPLDSLEWHKMICNDKIFDVVVFPTFRPDRALGIEKPDFIQYISRLSEVTDVTIKTFGDLCMALERRIEHFIKHGCIISDHGLDIVPFSSSIITPDTLLGSLYSQGSQGLQSTCETSKSYKTSLLMFLAKQYKKRDWAMQLHFGVSRSVNSKKLKLLGADTGFDSINARDNSAALQKLLDAFDKADGLPKTILYSLNPNENTMISTTIGAFANMQHGAAWWFNDTKDGMTAHMKNLAATHALGKFIGMLTDSRSFLSFTRHEYFRRILCNIIGTWVESGEYPADESELGQLVRDISYNNAVRYLGL